MAIKTLDELFVHTLKDMHYAESKVLKSLPKLIKAAKDEDLKAALDKHLTETEGQVERLKQVFQLIGEKPVAEKCEAIEGIMAEGDGLLDDLKDASVSDDGLIASAQAVEHYEIVRYRSLVMWAGALKYHEAVPLLQQSLDEERRADEMLTKFAAFCQANDDDKATKPAQKRSTSRKAA